MSTYVISDIHGCNQTFRRALKSIRLKKKDTLFILGDLIDRGNDSKGVLDTVFLLLEHDFDIRCIKGNHEQMLIDSFENITYKVSWMQNGGKETLKSFLTSDIEKIPTKYIDYIKSMKLYYEYDKYIFVHAALNMKIENPFLDKRTILWERKWDDFFDKNWLNDRIVIHGHTPMSREDIEQNIDSKNSIFCIDNGSYIKNRDKYGSLCVLKLDDLSLHFEKRLENDNH